MILLIFNFGSSGQWKAAVQQVSIFLAASQLIPTKDNTLPSYAAEMESHEESEQTNSQTLRVLSLLCVFVCCLVLVLFSLQYQSAWKGQAI